MPHTDLRKQKMDVPRFHTYPKEWGMQLHYTGPMPNEIRQDDVAVLYGLRDIFEKRQADVLSWKFDLKPLTKEIPGILAVLDRLWQAGVVVKFSKQFFTKHDQRPEYIYWYIWEDFNERYDVERGNTGTAHYIVQR